jgi:mRNA-degrading endonuclease RelE of RelBE toxin-antitoxin system
MNSELTSEFIKIFRDLPKRIQKTAKKNYRLWKQNPQHPSVEFKKLKTSSAVYSVRAGIGWRAVGVMKDSNTIVWFWIGSHAEYDKLLKSI